MQSSVLFLTFSIYLQKRKYSFLRYHYSLYPTIRTRVTLLEQPLSQVVIIIHLLEIQVSYTSNNNVDITLNDYKLSYTRLPPFLGIAFKTLKFVYKF